MFQFRGDSRGRDRTSGEHTKLMPVRTCDAYHASPWLAPGSSLLELAATPDAFAISICCSPVACASRTPTGQPGFAGSKHQSVRNPPNSRTPSPTGSAAFWNGKGYWSGTPRTATSPGIRWTMSPLNQLLGSSIGYRIAIEHQAGRTQDDATVKWRAVDGTLPLDLGKKAVYSSCTPHAEITNGFVCRPDSQAATDLVQPRA